MFFLKKIKKPLSAFLAGLLNGMLGTGGGIPLWFAVNAEKNRRTAYATSSAGVLILCIVSILLYRSEWIAPQGLTLISFWVALVGGACGAILLKRMPLSLLRILFSLLLIGSGGYSLVRAVLDIVHS